MLLVLLPYNARSQTTRAVKIVVASAPGGVNDILARMFADEIGRAQGVTIVIENRQGAGEVIGTEAVAPRLRTATRYSSRQTHSSSIRKCVE
jgi:tripartite-type tricarboxylate transporter receptor subunit TctC